MRPCGSPEDLERRRNRAIDLLQRGYQPVEVAHMVGADRRSVRRWNAAYRARACGQSIQPTFKTPIQWCIRFLIVWDLDRHSSQYAAYTVDFVV